MSVPTPEEIERDLELSLQSNQEIFHVLGSPESDIYKLANASKPNNGTINKQRFSKYFSMMLEDAIIKSDRAIQKIIDPK